MYATLLAQPVTWVRSTRKTARTSSASDGYRSIFGRSVLPWSFHNPLAVHRSLLVVILCFYPFHFQRQPAAPRNATVGPLYNHLSVVTPYPDVLQCYQNWPSDNLRYQEQRAKCRQRWSPDKQVDCTLQSDKRIEDKRNPPYPVLNWLASQQQQ
jgi:hypothetical protein